MANPDEPQAGLEWVRTNLFSIAPQWTVDVDLNSVRHETKVALHATQCDVTFMGQGAFNKLYEVQTECGVHIMRVSLPVDPQRKTASEVATIEWIRQNTTIPVPRIFASKDYRTENVIGFEWILMSKLPGTTLSSVWRTTSEETKDEIVRQLATYSCALFDNQAEGIGNLYSSERSTWSGRLGEIVSLEFLWGNPCLKHGTPRGPFQSSREWLAARLSLAEKDSVCVVEDSQTDEDDLEDAQTTLRIIQGLRKCVDIVFPRSNREENMAEPAVIHHDDLTQSNILVDENGTICGVVDWECVSWLPLWKACYYPTFLIQDRPRMVKPDCIRYHRDKEGELDELYWEHLMEYEMTHLRDKFIDSMRQLRPKWMRVFEESAAQRSLDYAIRNCDNGFLFRDIKEWIDDLVVKGNSPSYDLRDRVLAD